MLRVLSGSHVVVDPEKMRRRARVLRPLGMLVTFAGAALLLAGIGFIAVNPFDAFEVFWMPFVGGFALFPGILMWVAGNLARASADFASSQSPVGGGSGPLSTSFGAAATRSCPSCGNANPVGLQTCQVCGTKLA
ncbi:MAG: hypothetical protein ACRDJP_14420 [Actinomycetota bacterium]